jgi:hypothetical protein
VVMGILLAPIPNMLLPFSIMAPPPQGSFLDIFSYFSHFKEKLVCN